LNIKKDYLMILTLNYYGDNIQVTIDSKKSSIEFKTTITKLYNGEIYTEFTGEKPLLESESVKIYKL